MNRRRIAIRLAAAAAMAALASGCITQPMDETIVELATEELGETPSPIVDDEADRVVSEARDLNRRNAETDSDPDRVVWTKRDTVGEEPTEGGLIRDDSSDVEAEPREETSQNTSTDDDGSGDRAGGDDDRSGSAGDDARPTGGGSAGGDGGGSGGDGSGGDGSGGDGKARDDDGDGAGDGKGEEPAPTPKPQPEDEFTALAGASDESGDASGQAPRFADIRQLLIESDGKRARVTVAVAGRIPGALEADEVQGVGVDFYRTDERESDYQLFADGDDSGWRAFLHTPDGLVQYPGSFGIGGRVFVFEVPWSALGGKKAADVDMFIDWSKKGTPVNKATSDQAPEKDRMRVTPQ